MVSNRVLAVIGLVVPVLANTPLGYGYGGDMDTSLPSAIMPVTVTDSITLTKSLTLTQTKTVTLSVACTSETEAETASESLLTVSATETSTSSQASIIRTTLTNKSTLTISVQGPSTKTLTGPESYPTQSESELETSTTTVSDYTTGTADATGFPNGMSSHVTASVPAVTVTATGSGVLPPINGTTTSCESAYTTGDVDGVTASEDLSTRSTSTLTSTLIVSVPVPVSVSVSGPGGRSSAVGGATGTSGIVVTHTASSSIPYPTIPTSMGRTAADFKLVGVVGLGVVSLVFAFAAGLI
ncbi:hypothetical protein GGS20DRAFT_448240 [Poronia punctata]|nr:hypothetical protein GGS20DRAFT_448240 [Poronia punctata]